MIFLANLIAIPIMNRHLQGVARPIPIVVYGRKQPLDPYLFGTW
jgi:hypothetical protein